MSELHYTSTDGVHYSRRLYGGERMTACNAHFSNGFGQIVMISDVQLKTPLSEELFAPHIKSAWINLRYLVPWIAVRTSNLECSEPNSYQFTYEKSSSQDVAERWADETIKWRSESLTFSEWEPLLKENYWRPGDGRFSMELHVAAAPDGNWIIMLTCPHWLTDGRGLFPVLPMYFHCLRAELDGSSEPYSHLKWSEEIVRLPPTAVHTIDDIDDRSDLQKAPAAEVPQPIQFSRPVLEPLADSTSETVQESVVLSQEQTAAFHKICKEHKYSATSAINSVLVLADIETILRTSADKSYEFARVNESLKLADVFPVMVNIADMRSFISPYYTNIMQPGGTAGIVNTVFPTYHDMSCIRKCIRVGDDASVIKSFGSAFWDGVVANTQSLLKAGAKSTPRVFHMAQIAADARVPKVQAYPVSSSGVMSSSLGNIDKVLPLVPFRPAVSAATPSNPFAILDFIFGIRASAAAVIANAWEYDGRLRINLQSSGRWHSEKAWSIFGTAVREAFEQILSEEELSQAVAVPLPEIHQSELVAEVVA